MSNNKKKKIFTIIGAIAGLLILIFIFEKIMYVTTDNAQVEAHTVMLGFKVSGYVTDVRVVEGQKVEAGAVLAEVDERDYQNALKAAQGELVSIEAKKRDSERTFGRYKQLYSSGAISQAQYDTASSTYAEVKAKYDAIAAQVAQAELNLENTKIRAPEVGFIAKKSVEKGQLATPGVPLFGFVGARERWVTANFKETEIESIKIGAPVKIEVDALSKNFHGVIESISAATGATFTLLPPDNATGNFTKVVQRVPVRIQIKDIDEKDIETLRTGLSAYVKVSKH